eukprot:1184106-Prorocentrum_minimum.AAC.2
MQRSRQGLGEDVCAIVLGVHMKQFDGPLSNPVSNQVVANVDVIVYLGRLLLGLVRLSFLRSGGRRWSWVKCLPCMTMRKCYFELWRSDFEGHVRANQTPQSETAKTSASLTLSRPENAPLLQWT